MEMIFEEDPKFTKDFKKLKKKYRSLNTDLELFTKVLKTQTLGKNRHTALLHSTNSKLILKSRLFCKYLKGSSLRIVFVYYKNENKVIFIEIFFKGNKPREDKSRINMYK